MIMGIYWKVSDKEKKLFFVINVFKYLNIKIIKIGFVQNVA